MTRTILTLCGGIGGAKLVYGLSQIIPDENLINLVNTGDEPLIIIETQIGECDEEDIHRAE